MKIEEIKKDLQILEEHEVVLFGSYVDGTYNSQSDIDVAVITRLRNRKQMFEMKLEYSGKVKKKYDIQIFEMLPIVIKGSILEDHRVLFGNPLEIGMYFYYVRKEWEDFQHRMEIPTIAEIRKGLQT
ncbi:MAG: DNA polymerase subunit beta [Candidatus Lokiarchaeota archaeon]|nr:DNA polymerase subunit beta [Candidatus Lokiarchaeota archaeon]